MTNLVVWKRRPFAIRGVSDNKTGNPRAPNLFDEIWMAADTRVTDPSKISDSATKILELSASTHRRVADLGYQKFWTLRIGFGYTGAVFPALMTHAALKVFLDNLAPGTTRLPTLKQIADLTAYLVEQYVRDASPAFGNVPHCQIVLTGMSEFEGEPAAILIQKRDQYNDYPYTFFPLDLTKVWAYGTENASLRIDIDTLLAQQNPNYAGLEPKVALEQRIAAATIRTVGGTLQYGVLAGNGFQSYAVSHGQAKTFLGFNLEKDIVPRIGFDILLDGLK
jgi:hypothetical protein